jgi:hypothetical protein
MISASVNALELILKSNNFTLDASHFSKVIKCLVTLPIEKGEIVKSISLFVLNTYKFHEGSFTAETIELILSFFFDIPKELLNHSLNTIKEFIMLVGSKVGWEIVLELIPDGNTALISYLKRESKRMPEKPLKRKPKPFVKEKKVKIRIK